MTLASFASFLSTLSLGPAQRHRNLAVFPIVAPRDAPSGVLTLDEALGRGLAEVTEVSEQGSVPSLLFLNHGDEPILLVDGEELVGARQNRILNLSILAPGHGSLAIPVSCVEQGRWAWNSRSFSSSDRTIYAKLRRANVGSVSQNLRRQGSRNADQAGVWDSIARKSADMQVQSDTGAASALYEGHAGELDAFAGAFRALDHQVGAAFVVSGRLAGLEIFGSADLLARLLPKVVRGYALDALEEEQQAADETGVDPAAALKIVARSSATTHRAIGLGEDLRFEAPGMMGAGLIADGKVIHLTAYANSYA